RKSGYARGGRHRCAKILAVAPHVEIEQLHRCKSNRTAHATFAALLENCVFYISRMYEFSHSAMWERSRSSNVGISVVYATMGALASDACRYSLALRWP